MSNARLKLAKNQANAQQNTETGFLQFENDSCFSSTLLSKNNRTYSKNKQNNKCVCIHEIIRLIIMKMKMEMKKITYIGHLCLFLFLFIFLFINIPRSIQDHKYGKYKRCIKKHLSNT